LPIFSFFRKRDRVAERIRWLLTQGRIIEGTITKMVNVDGEPIGPVDVRSGVATFVGFEYTVSGVWYEATQQLNAEQAQMADKYLPGVLVSVRYDPRCPTSCVIE
jgi:hypothetical protein